MWLRLRKMANQSGVAILANWAQSHIGHTPEGWRRAKLIKWFYKEALFTKLNLNAIVKYYNGRLKSRMKTNGPFEYHKSPEKSSDQILHLFSFFSLLVTIFFSKWDTKNIHRCFPKQKFFFGSCLAKAKAVATRVTIASPIGGLPCPCLRRRAASSHRSPNWPRRPEKKSVKVGQKSSTTSWSAASSWPSPSSPSPWSRLTYLPTMAGVGVRQRLGLTGWEAV